MILPSKYARNIGVTFDSVLNFECRVTDICKSCYFNICNIYCIRKVLSTIKPTKILVNAFVTSRLDNCNSLLYGLPCGLLHKLQLTSTELCSSLNSEWLQVWPYHAIMTQEASLAARWTSSTFKLLLITLKALNNLAPWLYTAYRLLRSSSKFQLQVPLSNLITYVDRACPEVMEVPS